MNFWILIDLYFSGEKRFPRAAISSRKGSSGPNRRPLRRHHTSCMGIALGVRPGGSRLCSQSFHSLLGKGTESRVRLDASRSQSSRHLHQNKCHP